jgi:alpha-ketoglutarate-dependent taurine dioxygenase
MIKSVPLTKYIGEMAKGKHLTKYTDKDIAELKKLLFYRKAVFFEDQNLTKEQLKELGHRLKSSPDAYIFEQEINSKEVFHYGETWHTDRDYFNTLPMYTVFQVNQLPVNKLTGATEFVDMQSFYNYGMSNVLKNTLKDLTAIHEYLKSETKTNDGFIDRRSYQAIHPVVLKTDFENESAYSLFLNPAHVTKILGLYHDESQAILKAIYEKMYLYTEFHYIHRWKEGSLVIWNNRLCNHRGLKDFSKDETRIASRVVVY